MTVNLSKEPDGENRAGAELVPTTTGPLMSVKATPLAHLTGYRLPAPVDTSEPVRPEWMRTRATLRATAGIVIRRNTYRARKQLFYLPSYLVVLVVLSPRGLARLTRTLAQYLYDYDTAAMRHEHARTRGETAEYAAANRDRKANLRARWLVASVAIALVIVPVLGWTYPYTLACFVGVVLGILLIKIIPGRGLGEIIAGVIVWLTTWRCLPEALALIPRPPAWVWPVLATLAVLALGYHGRNRDRDVFRKTDLLAGGRVPPLKAEVVITALINLGLSKMSAKTEETYASKVHQITDPTRDGPGYRIDLQLPPGVTADDVVKRRAILAGNLRRPLGTVWPTAGRSNPAHLSLFVGDQVMSEALQQPWPLLRGQPLDIFAPQPQFTDQRGEWITLQLAYANMIIGAVPRMGKTYVLRQMLLTAGLDPRCRVYAFDGKGLGDLSSTRHFAHCYVRGARGEDKIQRVLEAVRELLAEMDRRADIIDGLSPEECPESKVTSELANRYPDLYPVAFGMDETQMYFGWGDKSNKEHKKIREEIEAGITELTKMGPAFGIINMLATQQVKEATMPAGIAQNAVIRFCLKIEGDEPNDRILGTGSYKRGIDAQMFDLEDKGIGYLKAEGAIPRIVRSVHGLDGVVAEELGERARRLREAAGLLTGEAAGETEQPAVEEAPDVLADVLTVMDVAGFPAMSLVGLVEHLEQLRPAFYGTWDPATLSSRLRGEGCTVNTVYCREETEELRGAKREWVARAFGERPV